MFLDWQYGPLRVCVDIL